MKISGKLFNNLLIKKSQFLLMSNSTKPLRTNLPFHLKNKIKKKTKKVPLFFMPIRFQKLHTTNQNKDLNHKCPKLKPSLSTSQSLTWSHQLLKNCTNGRRKFLQEKFQKQHTSQKQSHLQQKTKRKKEP